MSLTSRPNIDVNLCGPDGMTPLLCAAGSGHSGVVERYVFGDVDINVDLIVYVDVVVVDVV